MNPYDEINKAFTVKNGVKIYDFEKCIWALQKMGQFHFGDKFRVYENDLEVIRKLLIYAIRDQETALKLRIDLNKGIMLTGPVGCGKTSLMFLLNFFFQTGNDFKIKPCRDIAFEFASKGFSALDPYTQKTHKQNALTAYCFDDLGTEKQIKHFGNECNVMAEIMLTRYDYFIHTKTMTHVTTNLAASELEAFYGDRVRSRMRQMFNLIAFDKDSIDKR